MNNSGVVSWEHAAVLQQVHREHRLGTKTETEENAWNEAVSV